MMINIYIINLNLGENDNTHLLKQKGVYPYEYTNSFDKFNETNLPSKESFYSSLNDNNISEYEHAKLIWDKL